MNIQATLVCRMGLEHDVVKLSILPLCRRKPLALLLLSPVEKSSSDDYLQVSGA